MAAIDDFKKNQVSETDLTSNTETLHTTQCYLESWETDLC